MFFFFSESLEFWIANKYRGIWFYILTEHAEWVPLLAQVRHFVYFLIFYFY